MPAEPAPIPVAFSTTIEGFARAFRSRLPPATIDELKSLGIDFDHVQPAYPLEVWERTVRLAAHALFPELSPAESWRRLGQQFIGGYTQTTLGQALLTMARLIGPRRFMERIGRNLRTGGNFAVVTSQAIAPNEVELRSSIDTPFLAEWSTRESVMHHYRRGLFEGALEANRREGRGGAGRDRRRPTSGALPNSMVSARLGASRPCRC